MLDLHDPKQAYEIFRLQWMIEHGYSVLDLLKNLDAMIKEDQNESGVRTSLQSLFQDWEFGIGFDGAIWPCYQEFLEHDYPLILWDGWFGILNCAALEAALLLPVLLLPLTGTSRSAAGERKRSTLSTALPGVRPVSSSVSILPVAVWLLYPEDCRSAAGMIRMAISAALLR